MNIRTLLAAFVPLAFAWHAHAVPLVFDLNYNFGAVDAQGNIVVTITEAATAGDVTITVENHTGGFLNDLFLNYTPSNALVGATIANFVATLGVVGAPDITLGVQGFAIDFGYSTANDANRFNPGEAVSFDLDGNVALAVFGFNTLGGGPFGDDYYAAAHVNGVVGTGEGVCGSGSAKIGDINGGNVAGGGRSLGDCSTTPTGDLPEPASVLLVGIGLLALNGLRRRRA